MITETGYLSMGDGEPQLKYTLVRPAAAGTYGTLFEYSGYDPGSNPDATYVNRYVGSGKFAYIGVNLRGTGCSEGTFDFFQPAEGKDGAKVIQWVTQRSWSNGKVAMIGKSYPGITQLFVAGEQPAGLVAIAPGHFYADAYRDVARPGGIVNKGFSTLWSFVARPSYELQSGPRETADGDQELCTEASTGMVRGAGTNPFVQLLQHPYDDALVRERSPYRILDRIKVPMLATLSWQDEQLASRQTHLLSELERLNRDRRAKGDPETDWWATLTGGDHSMARKAFQYADQDKFYDFYLLDPAHPHYAAAQTYMANRAKVRVAWEYTTAPRWLTELDGWDETGRIEGGQLTPWALSLRSGNRLTEAPAGAGEAATTYNYTPGVGSQGISNPYYGSPSLPSRYMWDQAPPDGTAAHFTTAPFTEDRTLLGSASLDLWLRSTAPDTDLQVTLTEVRPDGQEVYVQKGWLRASQRALDPARSTELLPYQTHQEADVKPLTPAEPVLARVEIFPFGHVVRAGSALRVWVEAPTVLPELWSFVPYPAPAVNTVLHDAAHPSRLVLPLVPNDSNRVVALPACGAVIRQPCRPDPASVSAAEPVVPEAPTPLLLLVIAAVLAYAVYRRTARSARSTRSIHLHPAVPRRTL